MVGATTRFWTVDRQERTRSMDNHRKQVVTLVLAAMLLAGSTVLLGLSPALPSDSGPGSCIASNVCLSARVNRPLSPPLPVSSRELPLLDPRAAELGAMP
jgi:hypothetical protein